jgi:hypothetical protein
MQNLQVPQQAIGHVPPTPNILPAPRQQQPNADPPAQEGPMAAVTAGLRLAEQVLFVFVASLWPNAVGGVGAGEGREVFERFEVPAPPPLPPPAAGEGVRREGDVEGEGEDDGDEGAEEERREGPQERREQVIV